MQLPFSTHSIKPFQVTPTTKTWKTFGSLFYKLKNWEGHLFTFLYVLCVLLSLWCTNDGHFISDTLFYITRRVKCIGPEQRPKSEQDRNIMFDLNYTYGHNVNIIKTYIIAINESEKCKQIPTKITGLNKSIVWPVILLFIIVWIQYKNY